MAFVRYADRSAAVCFCPIAPYYLAGSAASAIDLDFSTASLLEVFKVDFSSTSSELPLAGNPITAGERFHSVAWGKTGSDTRLHPLGLVAGGLEDGSVTLWDPNRIIQGSEAARCTVAKLKKHSSPVRALDFNPNLVQYLATGSAEPELFMWDLSRPSIPVAMTSAKLPDVPGGTESDFTCTKWNEKVHQILASCTTSGKTIVQDMRRAKPVATLHDMSSMRRCSVLEWSPERPTQVLVASENDQTPTVQVWDLRNSASPLSELVGHSKGILSMSWSPHDPRLLLTCAKDSKTYCWDVSTSSIVAELPPLGAWHLHVQWSPITPGLFSVSAFDGKIGLCSFTAMKGVGSDGYAITTQPLSLVPKWMERPGGLSFGFGGKLAHISVTEKVMQSSTTGGPTKIKESKIHLKQLALEAESVPQSDAFDAVLRTGDREKISEYCKTRQGTASGEEKETWQMLGLMFSMDAKHQLLSHLGFDPAELPQPEATSMNGDDPLKPSVLETGPQDSGVNAAMDFFENLADEDVTSPKAEAAPVEEMPKKQEVAAGVNEDEIQKALLVGNYEAAVESCLKVGRDADALLIAHVAGASLFDRVMNRYMEQKPKPFMSLLSAVAANDFNKLIQSRSIAQWRETLAMLVAYVDDSETWGSLCDALGVRLYQSGSTHAASLCFICSGNLEKAVTVWSSQGADSLARMHEIIQKAFILGLAVPQQSSSESLCTIVHNYAQILASQGSVQAALDYLDMVPGEPSENLQILRDRIYGSGLVSKPEATWEPTPTYTPPAPSPAVPDYGSMTDHHQYHQPPAQPYPGGYSGGYAAPVDSGYDAPYQMQQPGVPSYGGTYHMQQPTVQHHTNAPPLGFQPTPPPQVHTGFTPQAPVHAPPPIEANLGVPSQPPPSMFQPTAPPPSVMQPHQSGVPTTTATQQPFVPVAPTPSPARPHGLNPMPIQPGAASPGSPKRPSSPPSSEPTPPHDITALNADVSNVPAQFKPIVTHLRGLFTKFEAANVAPSQKRILSDASKRTGLLFWDLNRGKLKPEVAERVMQYAQALANGDTATATKVLSDLTDTAWDEASSHWLSSFKRLIRLAQTIR